MSKSLKLRNNQNVMPAYEKTLGKPIVFYKKKQGGVKASAGSQMSLVSGNYHEDKVFAVMEMASFCMKIRHVFADTFARK